MNTNFSPIQQYIASDEIVNLVYESVKIPFQEMKISEDAVNRDIKNTIPLNLARVFANIGDELSNKHKQSLQLTINGEFTKPVIDSIIFRIPVDKKSTKQFAKMLYEDLIPCAFTGSLDTEFTKLGLVGKDLFLFRTKLNKFNENIENVLISTK